MPVVKNIPFKLNRNDVLRGMGMGTRADVRPEFDRLIAEMLRDEAVLSLIKPALAYEIHPVIKIENDDCYLEGGIILRSATIARLLPEAKALAIAVATIGPELESRVSSYFLSGQRLKGMILDAMGNSSTENVRLAIHAIVGEEAKKLGYKLSSPVSPGGAGFPLSEQVKIFKLVPADAIEVRLTETGMMIPCKSLSMVMGLGENMPVFTASERCDMCSAGKVCPYRYQPEHECEGTLPGLSGQALQGEPSG